MLRLTTPATLLKATAASLLALANTSYAADHPDFTGVWEAYASEEIQSSALTEDGQKLVDDYFAQYGDDFPEPGSYCVPPGLVGTMTSMVSYPIEVIHSENRVTILAEYDMQLRRIFLDGREIPENYPTTRMGYSVGQWDGDSLNTQTGLLSEYLMRRWPRTESTFVTERIYRTTRDEAGQEARGFVQPSDYDDVLVFEMTITDPALYDAPQSITMYYQKIPDDSFLEYDCPADLWRRALRGESY